jgi:hypothetical protein
MSRSKQAPMSRSAAGAAWRSRKGLFRLVALADAERLTGHTPDELRRVTGVQVVTRIYADGSREEALRVPAVLLLESRATEHRTV